MTPHYAIVIEWSEPDQTYVVSLPEWADRYAQPVADGATYVEAARRGHNALEHLIQIAKKMAKLCPRRACLLPLAREGVGMDYSLRYPARARSAAASGAWPSTWRTTARAV